METIARELEKIGFKPQSISLLQEKDGVTVARIVSGGGRFILKYFQRPEFRREIAIYHLLAQLGIPTLKLYASTERSLLIEDLADEGGAYRLGVPADLDDPDLARLLARWYKLLHRQGAGYAAHTTETLYSENDLLTPDALRAIQRATGTEALPVWTVLTQRFPVLQERLHQVGQTLTYNDFYYTNLAVARDRSRALMFDYNLLGRGYAYADLRNVCSSLSHRVREAFLAEYGPYDPAERLLDEVLSVLVTLCQASGRNPFPAWAAECLAELRSRAWAEKVEQLLL